MGDENKDASAMIKAQKDREKQLAEAARRAEVERRRTEEEQRIRRQQGGK